MSEGLLLQAQPLTAIGLPDYVSEGSRLFRVGENGVRAITVSQLRGPMGFYDIAVIEWVEDIRPTIYPLHQCEFIAI